MSTAQPTAGVVAEALTQGRLHYRAQRWSEAIEVLGCALEADGPGIIGATNDILFLRGMALVQAGSEEEGVDDLEAAAAASWLEARFQMALLYARQGRRRGAPRQRSIEHLACLLELAPAGPSLAAGADRVCFTLGGLYADGDDPEDPERAITVFRRGLALNPLSAVGHNHVGQLLMRTDQPLSSLG
jgi:tetratricopeptide (TPR) repeat protein